MKVWVFLLLTGCAARIPEHTVKVPPRLESLRPARGVVFVKAEVPTDAIGQALARAVPPVVAGQRALEVGGAGLVNVSYDLKRQPTRAEGTRDGLRMAVGLRGTIEVTGRSVTCKSDDAGLILVVTARPEVREGAWIVLAKSEVRIKPEGSVRCQPLPIALPLGPVAELLARPLQRAVEEALALPRLPLGPLAGVALDALAVPRELEASGERVCLDLDPRAIVLAPLAGEGGVLALALGVEVAPRVVPGACPTEAAPRKVPREVVVREEKLGESFRAEVALALPHDELARRLAPQVVGHEVGEGKNKVRVGAFELGDAGGRLLARVGVSGAIGGTLWLWGTPEVHEREARLVLSVPDLRVAVETRDLITRLRLWAWERWDGGLPAWLRARAVHDLTDRVEAARRALEGKRDVAGLQLEVMIARLRPGFVESRPGVVAVHALLEGSAELSTALRSGADPSR